MSFGEVAHPLVHVSEFTLAGLLKQLFVESQRTVSEIYHAAMGKQSSKEISSSVVL